MRLRRHKSIDDSTRALQDAQQHVEIAKARNPEVYSVAGEMKRIGEKNHFAEEIYTIMRGNPKRRDAL